MALCGAAFWAMTAQSGAFAQTRNYSWNPVKKSEVREMSRWSLNEWLATKERNRLMDMWLAIHTPSPYEAFASFDSSFAEGYSGRFRISRANFGMYATIFGLEGQYESAPESRWNAFFNLRLLGFDSQGTNLTFQTGLRATAGAADYRSAVIGGHMTLSLTRFFGLYGLYRHYFNSTADAAGTVYGGGRQEAQVFIDYRFLRVYGGYFWEQETLEGASTGERKYKGPFIGLKLFF